MKSTLKEKISSIKKSVLQEYMLLKKCINIEYKSVNYTRKNTNKNSDKSPRSRNLSRKIKSVEAFKSKSKSKSTTLKRAKTI